VADDANKVFVDTPFLALGFILVALVTGTILDL
jgi:hypothetical protein